MKNILFILTLFTVFNVASQTGREAKFRNYAPTPPMGWNSWDCFGPSVKENEVKLNADYMAAKLKNSGWQYIIVDIRWYVDNQTTGTYNAYNNSTFIYDEYGRYTPSPTRFPSAAAKAGFKPLSDYVHGLGLKFGIHIMRGVPKAAVTNKLPIKNGNGKTAADIYSTAEQCTWLQDNYTIDAAKAGAQEYYNSIFELYASWGVDYVKIDDLSRPYHDKEIELIRNAMNACGRPMVLSMSPGATPVEQNEHAANHANLWRIDDDFWDNWSQLNSQFALCDKWSPYIRYGAWPDADMLPLGHISIRGERGVDRQSNFTKDEQYTLMTLWSIFRSPLMFGGHLPDNSTFTDSLLTNKEVLAMHGSCMNSRQWFNENDLIAWTADAPEDGTNYLALFNNGGDGFVSYKNILYRSGPISRLTDNYGVNVDVPLPEGSNQLFLIVNDGGDGISCDHADWINPTIYKANGDSLKLTTLNWELASAGWGTTQKNLSIGGSILNVKGKTFSNGIGTHSRSVVLYNLPAGYNRFKCFAGLDKGGTDQTGNPTVEFLVSTADPTLRFVDVNKAKVNSGRISRTLQRTGKKLEAQITGAKKLYLVLTDAGDNFNYDHGDWINPTLYKANGDSLSLTTLTPVKATSGWDVVKTNKSLDNNTLKVNGVTYTKGYGTNSNSIIEFNLPEGYDTFKSFCGFDDEVLNASNGVSIEFLVFTEDPTLSGTADYTFKPSVLGYKGNVTLKELWKGNTITMHADSGFTSKINVHGAKLYKIEALDRRAGASIQINMDAVRLFSNDSINLNVQVSDENDDLVYPVGYVQIFDNDSLISTLKVNGKVEFHFDSLEVGVHQIKARFSGNTDFLPVSSETILITVTKDNTGKMQYKLSEIKIRKTKEYSELSGLTPGDLISIYDIHGKILSIKKTELETFQLQNNGISLIKVTHQGSCFSFKVLN